MADVSWTGSFLKQPMTGFPAVGQIPSYSGVKFKPGFETKLPSLKGIDFQTGKRVDLANYFQNPTFDIPSSFTPGGHQTDYGASDSSTGDVSKKLREQVELYKELQPMILEQMQSAAGLQAELSRRQMLDLYPLMSAASAESTARNLAASKAYRTFAEQLPSNVQNIMASKQGQMQSAQAGEAALQQATADQLRAAKESQGRFAGQYISFA